MPVKSTNNKLWLRKCTGLRIEHREELGLGPGIGRPIQGFLVAEQFFARRNLILCFPLRLPIDVWPSKWVVFEGP